MVLGGKVREGQSQYYSNRWKMVSEEIQSWRECINRWRSRQKDKYKQDEIMLSSVVFIE
jgi:hypothetical protein